MQSFWRNWQDMASRSWMNYLGIYGATYIGVASQTSNKRNIPFNGKRNIWLGYLVAKMRWVNGMALARVGDKGHLSMERKYAQVQVRRGAQEPNQRTKTRKPRKRKSCENQGVTTCNRNRRPPPSLKTPLSNLVSKASSPPPLIMSIKTHFRPHLLCMIRMITLCRFLPYS